MKWKVKVNDTYLYLYVCTVHFAYLELIINIAFSYVAVFMQSNKFLQVSNKCSGVKSTIYAFKMFLRKLVNSTNGNTHLNYSYIKLDVRKDLSNVEQLDFK